MKVPEIAPCFAGKSSGEGLLLNLQSLWHALLYLQDCCPAVILAPYLRKHLGGSDEVACGSLLAALVRGDEALGKGPLDRCFPVGIQCKLMVVIMSPRVAKALTTYQRPNVEAFCFSGLKRKGRREVPCPWLSCSLVTRFRGLCLLVFREISEGWDCCARLVTGRGEGGDGKWM